MRTSRWTLCLLSLSWVGCSVSAGNGSGFDGSVFNDRDAAARDAATGEDGGAPSDQDAGATESDAGTVDGGASSSTKPEQVPAVLAAATCGALTDCMGAELLSDYLNVSDCVAFITQQQEQRDLHWLADSIKAGRVRWNPAALTQCQTDLRAYGCDVKSRRLPASCKQAIEGTVTVDGACGIDFDCQGDAYCKRSASAGCGVCTARNAAGVACNVGSDCADRLVCPSSKVCALPVAADDACNPAGGWGACSPGFACLGASGSETCRSISSSYTGAEGNACDALTALCAPGLACERTTGTMGICVKPVSANGSCKGARPSECPMGQYCDATQAGATGMCLNLPADGAACQNSACAPGNVCLSGRCRAFTAVGSNCVDARQCYSNTCLQTVCVLPLQCLP
jgi:hypothetical protein